MYSIIVLCFRQCPRSPLLLHFGLLFVSVDRSGTAPILCSIGHCPFRFMTFFPRTPGSVYWAISQSAFNIFGHFAQPVFNTFGCFALQPWAPDPTRGLRRAVVINNLCHFVVGVVLMPCLSNVSHGFQGQAQGRQRCQWGFPWTGWPRGWVKVMVIRVTRPPV